MEYYNVLVNGIEQGVERGFNRSDVADSVYARQPPAITNNTARIVPKSKHTYACVDYKNRELLTITVKRVADQATAHLIYTEAQQKELHNVYK